MTANSFEETPETFAEILSAVEQTPRGRWFLKELLKRNRIADTEQVLLELQKLKSAFSAPTTDGHLDILRAELEEMASSIRETRLDIAAIKPDDNANNRIMAATEELDAIVTATERATTDILASAERLQELAEKICKVEGQAEIGEEIETIATNIFTLCSFQDITGQRTTKVVNTMRYLEQRVNAMIEIWGTAEQKKQRDNLGDVRPDAHLLNGPSKDGEGVSQDQIDQMLDAEDIEQAASEIGEADAGVAPSDSDSADDADGQDFSSADDPVDVADMDEDETISQDDIDALFG